MQRELPLDQYELLMFCVFIFLSQRGERATDLEDQIACWTFCLSHRSSGTMLTILAAGSVFFPGLFLLSKQCLKSIPALRWSEGDAVIVSARLDLLLCFTFVMVLILSVLTLYLNCHVLRRYKSFHHTVWLEIYCLLCICLRLVSSVQAVMASSAGYIISSSCKDVLEDQ